MKEMFEASVDGQAYDADRWGAYYKPRGVTIVTAEAPASAPTATAEPAIHEDDGALDTPVSTPAPAVAEAAAPTAPVATPPAGGAARAEDILAMIRNRQKTS
jgi:hypothetical protein